MPNIMHTLCNPERRLALYPLDRQRPGDQRRDVICPVSYRKSRAGTGTWVWVIPEPCPQHFAASFHSRAVVSKLRRSAPLPLKLLKNPHSWAPPQTFCIWMAGWTGWESACNQPPWRFWFSQTNRHQGRKTFGFQNISPEIPPKG